MLRSERIGKFLAVLLERSEVALDILQYCNEFFRCFECVYFVDPQVCFGSVIGA